MHIKPKGHSSTIPITSVSGPGPSGNIQLTASDSAIIMRELNQTFKPVSASTEINQNTFIKLINTLAESSSLSKDLKNKFHIIKENFNNVLSDYKRTPFELAEMKGVLPKLLDGISQAFSVLSKLNDVDPSIKSSFEKTVSLANACIENFTIEINKDKMGQHALNRQITQLESNSKNYFFPTPPGSFNDHSSINEILIFHDIDNEFKRLFQESPTGTPMIPTKIHTVPEMPHKKAPLLSTTRIPTTERRIQNELERLLNSDTFGVEGLRYKTLQNEFLNFNEQSIQDLRQKGKEEEKRSLIEYLNNLKGQLKNNKIFEQKVIDILNQLEETESEN